MTYDSLPIPIQILLSSYGGVRAEKEWRLGDGWGGGGEEGRGGRWIFRTRTDCLNLNKNFFNREKPVVIPM